MITMNTNSYNAITAAAHPVMLDRFASITAQHEKTELSEKYRFIPTTRVIDVLADLGWRPVKAQEMTCRNEDRRGFQKHLIRFRHAETTSLIVKDQVLPEIVLTNSHDGLASFQIMAGLFRVVCANGLTVADTMFQTHRIRHMGYTDQAVALAVEDVTKSIPMIADRVDQFTAIELTPNEQGIYVAAALAAKYGNEEVEKRDFAVDRILAPVRTDDAGSSLWKTFNRVQEKLIKGGKYERKPISSYHPEYKKTGKARAVNSISENVRINQALWMLTEKMAELKGRSN